MRLEQEVIYKKVCECLEKNKIFLDQHLTLSRLGGVIGTNTTYLSNAINNCSGKNFCTLVNDYRIQHAVKLINAGEYNESLRGMHLRCGFASSSAFYDALKRRTGATPLSLVRAAMARRRAAPDESDIC